MNGSPTYCFLINCASNAFRGESLFRNHEREIKELFPDADFVYVRKEDSIEQISRDKAQTYTHIIACGGDGTVSQTAKGMMGSSAALGVLPLGSGNDFAKSIGLKTDFNENLQVLLRGKTVKIDVVKHERGIFLNTFGIGVDGLTSYYAARSSFKKGAMRYFWGGLKALVRAKPFSAFITIPELNSPIKKRVWMAAVANGKTEGGKYTISPGSVNHDGKIEIIIVNDISRIQLFFEFIKLSLGFSFRSNVVEEYATSTGCKIETQRVLKAHADGEEVSGVKIYNFRLLKAALPVMVKQ